MQCSHTEERNTPNLWDNYPKQGWEKKQWILKVICFTIECRIKDAASVRKSRTFVTPDTMWEMQCTEEGGRGGGTTHSWWVLGRKMRPNTDIKWWLLYLRIRQVFAICRKEKGCTGSPGRKEWACPYRQEQREVRKYFYSGEENPIPQVSWQQNISRASWNFFFCIKDCSLRLGTDWQPFCTKDM